MNPFEISPPQWLVDIAKPVDGTKLGQMIGMGIADLVTSAQRDPNAPADASWLDSRKGFAQASAEVRMNQQDPMWRQKQQIQLGNLALAQKQHWMNIDLTQRRIGAMDKTATDEAEDQKLWTDNLSQIGTDANKILDMPMPAFKGRKHALMWQEAVSGATKSGAAIQRKALNSDLDKSLLAIQDPTFKADALQIIGMNDLKMKQQASSLLFQRMGLHEENVKGQAEVDALEKGYKPIIKIDPKGGVTTTYKSDTTSNSPYQVPTVVEIGGHKRLMYLHYAPQDLDKLTPKQASDVNMLTHEINRLKAQMSKANLPKDKADIQGQLDSARKDYEAIFKISAASAAPSASTPSAAPATPGKTSTGLRYSIVPADELSTESATPHE